MNRESKFTFSAQQMTILAVMMALDLVISRFSIPIGTSHRLSFGFIITALLGILYGPWVSGLANAASDLLKSFIFGAGGPFFIGFTLSAFLDGVIYGLFLQRKEIRWTHVLGASLSNTIFVNLLLNTYWLTILYKSPFKALLTVRIPQNVIMTPIRFLIILTVTQLPQLKNIFNKYQTK